MGDASRFNSRRFTYALALPGLLALAACAAAQAPAEKPAPPPRMEGPVSSIAYNTFPSGLQLVVYEEPRGTRMAVSVSYRVGATDEPAGKEGIAWLSAELISQGLHDGASAQPWKERVSALGGTSGLTLTYDETEFASTVPEKQFARLTALEAQRMHEPLGRLTDEAFVQARQQAVETLRQRYAEEPTGARLRWLHEKLLPGHAYGRPLYGTPESIERLTLEDVRAFVKANYSPAHAVLVVSGPMSMADVKFTVARSFLGLTGAGGTGRTPAVRRTPPSFPDELQAGKDLVVVDGPVKAPQLNLVWTLPGLHSGRYIEPILSAGGVGLWVRKQLEGDARVRGVRSEYRELDGVSLVLVTLDLQENVLEEAQVRDVADQALDSLVHVLTMLSNHTRPERSRQAVYIKNNYAPGPAGHIAPPLLINELFRYEANKHDFVLDSKLGLQVYAHAVHQLRLQLEKDPTQQVARLLRATGRPDAFWVRAQQYIQGAHSEELLDSYLYQYVRTDRARMLLVRPARTGAGNQGL